jgi:uncharacterized membrane protein (DUF106 family)
MENVELVKAMQEMMDVYQAKMKAEMRADREEMMQRMEATMDGRQEEMKTQLASLASRIEAGMVVIITDVSIDIPVAV